MTTFYQEPDHAIYCGHALDVLKGIPAESVDMAITSPPYWGLRTYKTEPIIWGENHCDHEWQRKEMRLDNSSSGTGKQITSRGTLGVATPRTIEQTFCLKCNAWRGELGLEPTIELYIQHLILIFNEAKRVLKKTGTCWVNIDDSYASGKGSCFNPGGGADSLEGHAKLKDAEAYPLSRGNISELHDMGLLPKSLCLIPQRFAIAMVENGWILRNDIVWNKSNPMPESVKDRFTGSWEHLFFFVKSKKYWFEQQFEPVLPSSLEREKYGWNGTFKGRYDVPWEKRENCKDQSYTNPLGRNKRDVWEINTAPYPGAHFATFPEKLCEIPILAGCPETICKKCGKARERIYERTGHANKREPAHVPNNSPTKVDSTGWAPTEKPTNKYTDCGCNAGFEFGVVLDPFTGSGTAQAVAKRLGRKSIGIELNPAYCKLAAKRLQEIPMAMPLLVA